MTSLNKREGQPVGLQDKDDVTFKQPIYFNMFFLIKFIEALWCRSFYVSCIRIRPFSICTINCMSAVFCDRRKISLILQLHIFVRFTRSIFVHFTVAQICNIHHTGNLVLRPYADRKKGQICTNTAKLSELMFYLCCVCQICAQSLANLKHLSRLSMDQIKLKHLFLIHIQSTILRHHVTKKKTEMLIIQAVRRFLLLLNIYAFNKCVDC